MSQKMIKLKLEEKTLKPAPPVLQLITRQILPKTNNLSFTRAGRSGGKTDFLILKSSFSSIFSLGFFAQHWSYRYLRCFGTGTRLYSFLVVEQVLHCTFFIGVCLFKDEILPYHSHKCRRSLLLNRPRLPLDQRMPSFHTKFYLGFRCW